MIRSRMIIRKRITSVLQWLAAIRKQPDELEERLKGILLNTNYDQLDEAALERVKKKKIGGFYVP